ncbi:MAG: selenocysteine-specific translation elongation factor [Deltaproteobacteria bacterium]|nr:selenocysteine-specific translation elongation factor [Deltaproteobacteria bacterium]
MKHIVLGTAGHVDHGKTALIKALTGIDTDRLKEEKERGITIELGFASLSLPSGQMLGIVDVPGHERFVRNMVSGATGIDMVLLVIAADEGVMPQTREHLAICMLLGIKKGLVALTKKDLVDEDWLELVTDDVHQFVQGTFLADAPVIAVSSVSGEGLPELVAAMDRTASSVEQQEGTGLFRLPIDRVFTMRGFGTVVTGTLTSGDIKVAEAVEILPGGITARVRGLQVHNQSVPQAEAGQRTAINLQGIEKATVERGSVLVRPGTLEATTRLDVFFEYLRAPEKRLKNRTLVRFHGGTSEIIARMILLGEDDLAPGGSGYCQIVLESPFVAVAGDRFVVRSYSPVMTIGGGEIIDPLARKHKRHAAAVLLECEILRGGTERQRSAVLLERAGLAGIDLEEFVERAGISGDRLQKILASLVKDGQAVLLDGDDRRFISLNVYEELQRRVLDVLKAYHGRHPLKEGLLKEELRITLGPFIAPRLFNAAMKDLEKTGKIVVERENVRLPGHKVSLKGDMEDLRGQIAGLYLSAGYAPPTLREILERYPDRRAAVGDVLGVMLKEAVLVKISEELYFHRDVLTKLREDYKAVLLRDGKATPASFKELTGLSRKFIIPLMEYFDAAKLTIRAGDHRILREKSGV